MENKKFEVKGNEVLYKELVNEIKCALGDLQEDVSKLSCNMEFRDLDRVMLGIEKLHAYAGNLMAFLRYKAFLLDVVSETDSVKESEVQETE